MLPGWTVVGFSGHRNLLQPDEIKKHISTALDGLIARHAPLVAISSLARGSDTLFIEQIAKRCIPFIVVLPFSSARFQQDFGPEEWKGVLPLLAKAVYIEEISGSQTDEEAYMDAGLRVVDQCDVVLTVWNGRPSNGPGGTGDVVAYARQLQKPLIWVEPTTGTVTAERQELIPRIAAGLKLPTDPHASVVAHFNELDLAALRNAPNVRHLIQQIVLLQLVASAIGLVAIALGIHGAAGYAMAVFEVLALGTAFLLGIRRHKRHTAWVTSRMEAEVCRSFLAFWSMRHRMKDAISVGAYGVKQFVRKLRLLQQLDPTPEPSLDDARAAYLDGRVRTQIAYFAQQARKAQTAYRWLKGIAVTSTALAATLAAVHLGLSLKRFEGLAMQVVELLSLILPLVSTAAFSVILTREFARRAARYKEMLLSLEDNARRIGAVRTWNGLIQSVMEVEEELLNEAIEWQYFRRFATETR
jgi:uncharacterized membrane protein YbaN (DUF454 family)